MHPGAHTNVGSGRYNSNPASIADISFGRAGASDLSEKKPGLECGRSGLTESQVRRGYHIQQSENLRYKPEYDYPGTRATKARARVSEGETWRVEAFTQSGPR
jgi:hypothetical protein